MGYGLVFPPGVEDEIADFVASFPDHLQERVVSEIEANLLRLAHDPLVALPRRGSRPRFAFQVKAGGVIYPVIVSWGYSPDERTIVISQFRRLAF